MNGISGSGRVGVSDWNWWFGENGVWWIENIVREEGYPVDGKNASE